MMIYWASANRDEDEFPKFNRAPLSLPITLTRGRRLAQAHESPASG
jgi:hypothetical protein